MRLTLFIFCLWKSLVLGHLRKWKDIHGSLLTIPIQGKGQAMIFRISSINRSSWIWRTPSGLIMTYDFYRIYIVHSIYSTDTHIRSANKLRFIGKILISCFTLENCHFLDAI